MRECLTEAVKHGEFLTETLMEGVMKNKFIGWLTASAIIMLLLPWAAVTFVKGDAGMAVVFLLFFVVDPVYAMASGYFAGKSIRKMWYVPAMTAIMFLAGVWIFFDMGESAFVIYAGVYLVIGMVSMLISLFISKRAQ